jgi:hypothetical protein
MRMLRDLPSVRASPFKALSFQFAQMFLSCTMFQPTTKARNYRILYVCARNVSSEQSQQRYRKFSKK